MTEGDRLAQAFDHCRERLASDDRDRFVANLFAPAELRADLAALYAFDLELASVRDKVREALAGEVRLQWWRDTLTAGPGGEGAQHPIAAALFDVIARRKLPVAPLVALTEARIFDLYDDPMPTLADLEGYCGETSSAIVQLACLILADGRDPGSAEAAGHAGVALGMTSLLIDFACMTARSQLFLPLDLLAQVGLSRDDVMARKATPALARVIERIRSEARRHLDIAEGRADRLDLAVMPAFLPLAVARLALDRMDRFVADPFAIAVTVPLWRRPFAIWRMAVRARKRRR